MSRQNGCLYRASVPFSKTSRPSQSMLVEEPDRSVRRRPRSYYNAPRFVGKLLVATRHIGGRNCYMEFAGFMRRQFSARVLLVAAGDQGWARPVNFWTVGNPS